ncbi:hypothetical protein TNCT_423181 [Trichonephila clavata]|uniref:Uncharacterized protein n=1 Tax=Trichonephila clavata TaxID=2740835 RepID=A0A8X6KAR4_TRICU|nr:hypothetical protein TNCT_423181 [Trichonephila clavata]
MLGLMIKFTPTLLTMKPSLPDISHKTKCIYALPKSPVFRLTKTLSYALTIHYTVIFNVVCIHDLSNVGFSSVISKSRTLVVVAQYNS